MSADRSAESLVATMGPVFARFDAQTQDSGNVSYGVATGDGRWFVKTAGDRADTRPLLGFDDRVALLRNAARLHGTVRHRALASLHAVIESATGPLLVYEWLDGELLHAPPERRGDPASPLARLSALPIDDVIAAVERVLDLHVALAAAGWIARDFYDGSLLYDFDRRAMHVVDLDGYHCGATTNTMGRMFGSSRYMAPEEHVLGAPIDERTTVFTLGRMLFELLGDGRAASDAFRGSAGMFAVATQATRPAPEERFGSVAELHAAWRAAVRAP